MQCTDLWRSQTRHHTQDNSPLPEPRLTPSPLRIFHLLPGSGIQELAALPSAAPTHGFYWIAATRTALAERTGILQQALQACTGQPLVDLHLSDLLNAQLPSRYDYTVHYDLLVFHRLASAAATVGEPTRAGEPPALRRIDTAPLGFVLFEQLLLSIHPDDCSLRDNYAARLLAAQPTDQRESRSGVRLPSSSADLMLRALSLAVDGFLELRRDLSRQLDHWQNALLRPTARFTNWGALLDARLALHELDNICDDQHSAVQDWYEALEEGEASPASAAQALDLLRVRSRDLLEHIERVSHHVRRLEHNTETALQMHFSVQSHRANDIMRTLTTITAVFLPLNLIAAIFGMNFDVIPLTHGKAGFWWILSSMGAIALALLLVFWRKRYLARSGRE